MHTKDQMKIIRSRPCATPGELHHWVVAYCGIDVPRQPVCAGHDAPFEYIKAAYFEPSRDLVAWAPRGGGKTRLGAVATLLDLVHKPGIAVRILGGSMEQSLKMWEHLLPDLENAAKDEIETPPRGRRATLKNRSSCAVLPQSQRAVRGLRVQKMRCDEVEMFDADVWAAAQLVTKSITLPDGTTVRGAIEALSTHHKPWGLMAKIIEGSAARNVRVIKWCILDVLEPCPPERECKGCELLDDCGGVAKEKCKGFFRIDDAIAMKRRVSRDMWEAEMLCRRPNVSGAVFPNFDVDVHVKGSGEGSGFRVQGSGNANATPADSSSSLNPEPRTLNPLSLALDFGFANPFVCLWVASREDGTVHVVDEYVQSGRTVHEHLEQIEGRGHGVVRAVACDPAGSARSDQTATSNVTLLRSRGYRVRTRHSMIQDGLEMIRAALRPAAGTPKLFIDPRCQRLIKAMRCYRYPDGGGEVPLKDGEHDHLVDALRYWFVNRPTELPPPRRY